MFSDRFSQRVAKRYRNKGLTRTSQRMVDFLCERDVEGATVLEIGGGVGEIQLELLRRGATRATNLEISKSYEDEAGRLLDGAGLTDRVTRRLVDIVESPEDVEPADIVVLHRVVCCYPDYERLLTAAADHASRLLVFSHPRDNAVFRILVRVENLTCRLRRQSFRAFVHPAAAMEQVLVGAGLTTRATHEGMAWRIVGLERDPRSHPNQA